MEEIKTNVATNEEENTETNTEVNKTYTEDEVNSLVDSRISKAYEKWSKQQAKAVAEAEKLSKMSEEERQKATIEKLQQDLENKEKAINIRENKIVCMSEMEKRNIPTVLIDFIITDDADTMLENLTTFEKTLKKLINDEVSKKISGNTPKNSNVETEGMTKDKFKNLGLSEQADIYKKDKDLYMSLIN